MDGRNQCTVVIAAVKSQVVAVTCEAHGIETRRKTRASEDVRSGEKREGGVSATCETRLKSCTPSRGG